MPRYKTKTQKKRALHLLNVKAFGLLEAGILTINEYGTIDKLVKRKMKQL